MTDMNACLCPTRQPTELVALVGDALAEVALRCVSCGGEVGGTRMLVWESADDDVREAS